MDNGSSDNSFGIVAELSHGKKNVIILPRKQYNIGFASGNNELFKHVSGEYVFLLNQDTLLSSDYLEKLVRQLDNHAQAGSATGKIMRWRIQKEDKLTDSPKSLKIDTAGLNISKSFRVSDLASGETDQGKYNGKKEIFGVSGALPLYRSEAIKEVGFFDSAYFSYKEDVDLAFRLQSAGWQAYRVGGAVAYHDRGLFGDESSNDFKIAQHRRGKSLAQNYLSYRNHLYTLIKNLSLVDFLMYGVFILWYECKKLFYLIVFEQRSLYGLVEVVKKFPRLLQQRKIAKPISVKRWLKKND